MIYCAWNMKENKHAVVMANSMDEAGNIACDFWMNESVAVMSLEQFVREHGGIMEMKEND